LIISISLLAMLHVPALAETRRAQLEGFQEVPVVSTTGTGEFLARIASDDSSIDYILSYEGLENAVAQAHIHLGQRSVNGGIVIFLCTNLGNGPAGTQPCPPSPATITGTITAGDVVPVASQGIAAGDLAEVLRAMRKGLTYANVHSLPDHPGGEIRGQVTGVRSHH
jgi:hypothetical protein